MPKGQYSRPYNRDEKSLSKNSRTRGIPGEYSRAKEDIRKDGVSNTPSVRKQKAKNDSLMRRAAKKYGDDD